MDIRNTNLTPEEVEKLQPQDLVMDFRREFAQNYNRAAEKAQEFIKWCNRTSENLCDENVDNDILKSIVNQTPKRLYEFFNNVSDIFKPSEKVEEEDTDA